MFPNLRAEMARRNLSSKDLARIIGMNERTLQNKLSGKSEFTLSEILQICKQFDGNVDYLFSLEVVGA